MKIIKYLAVLIAGIACFFLVAGLFVSKEVHVVRHTVIDAPLDLIHSHIKSNNSMDDWFPWRDYDPEMNAVFEGIDGEVGSRYIWEGKEVGKGYQEITAVSPDRVEALVTFLEPMESSANTYFQMEAQENGVKVSWGFKNESPYPWNTFNLFLNMDEMIGKDFSLGLEKLKQKIENLNKQSLKRYNGYEIKEVDFPAKVYIGKKGKIAFDQIEAFYRENLGAIFSETQKAGLVSTGQPSGVFFNWDEGNKRAELAAAIPVADSDKIKNIKQFERIDVPAGKALHISYYGPYDSMEAPHKAMDEYMNEKGLQHLGFVIEEYITDPSKEPDPNKCLTEIYYRIK